VKAAINTDVKNALAHSSKLKSPKIDLLKYQDLMQNDGFLRADCYYENSAMFAIDNNKAIEERCHG